MPPDLPEDPSLTYDPRSRRLLGAVPADAGPAITQPLPPRIDTPILPPSADPLVRKFHPRNVPDALGQRMPVRKSPPYVVYRRIGGGGFGDVFEGVQPNLNRIVAIKRLRDASAAPEDSLGRFEISNEVVESFLAEASIAATLDHPNIVPVYSLELDEDGLPALAMKLVRGTQWYQLIDRDRGNMPYEDFIERHLQILIPVCQAVAFAHSRGIVHRDLKPSQVVVGEFGEVLLLDWGLAVIYDRATVDSEKPDAAYPCLGPTVDSAGSPAGTPAFMAPEQTDHDARLICPATDVYLLGGILYYLITGAYPHPGPGRGETFRQARFGYVPEPQEAAPNKPIDPELAKLAMDAMQIHIPKRIQTADEFLARVRAHLTGASRRRESDRLAREAQEVLDGAGASYTRLNECHELVRRAEGLWPANTTAIRLRQRALAQHVSAALAANDLALARLQAEQMAESPERTQLLGAVEQGELRARRERRIRRAAVMATIASLVVIIAGGSLFSWRLGKEKAEAVRQKLEADRQREQAEARRADVIDGLTYMTGELIPTLSVNRDPEQVEGVVKKIGEIYARIPEETLTLEQRRIRGLHKAAESRLFAVQGKIPQAIASIGEALAIQQAALDAVNASEDPELTRHSPMCAADLVRSAVHRAGLRARSMHHSEVIAELESYDELLSHLTADFPEEIPFASDRFHALTLVHDYAEGLAMEPERASAEASLAAIASTLRKLAPDSDLAHFAAFKVDEISAETLFLDGKRDEGIALLRAVIAREDDLRRRFPERRQYLERRRRTEVILAYKLSEVGEHDEAVALARGALADIAAEPSQDREIMARIHRLSMLGELLLDAGSHQEAIATLSLALDDVGTVRPRLPDDFLTKGVEGRIRVLLGIAQNSSGLGQAATQNLHKGADLLAQAAEGLGDHSWRVTLLQALVALGDENGARREAELLRKEQFRSAQARRLVRQVLGS
jgi:serine/threonine protein kinase